MSDASQLETDEAVPTQTPVRNPPHHGSGLLPTIQSLLYVLIASIFLMTFTVQPIRIPSPSMEPTLLVGDFLLLDKSAGPAHGLLPPANLHHGEIIVFHDPVDDPSVHLVKRIIGMPGDRLHLRNGVVYLNGTPLREPYAVHHHSREDQDSFRDDFPSQRTLEPGVNPAWWIRLRALEHAGEITVPPDSYFVMGDNRDDSEDSRYWGFVPRAAIVGEPVLVYFSLRQPEDSRPGRFGFGRWERTFRVVH